MRSAKATPWEEGSETASAISHGRPQTRPSSKRWQLREEAAAHVRSLILSGALQAGSYVRLEPLAKELEMSVTPVREALMTLREQGFVELRPNRGFSVVPISGSDISDLFMVHAFTGGELAARAAGALDADGIHRLDQLNEALEQHAADGNTRDFEVVNDLFHATINRAANAPRLAWFYAVGIPLLPRWFLADIPGWIDSSLRDHRRITNGLREQAAEASRRAMAEHIETAGRLIVEHVISGGAWPHPVGQPSRAAKPLKPA